MSAVTGQVIDPGAAIKNQQLTYNPTTSNVQAPTMQAQSAGQAQTAQFNPATASSAQFHGMDPSFMGTASAQQGHGGERLGFGISPQSVMEQAMKSFQAQLPSMNINFADQSDQLAKRTSAMGRTGSGLFNRDTGYISDRARASREGMLGNLAFQAATSDQAADLQAQINTQQLLNSQEQRFSQASLANAQLGTQVSLANAAAQGQAALQNQQLQNQLSMFNTGQQNNMGQFNSQMGLNAGQFNAGQSNQMNQFNAQLGQQAGMFNADNQMQAGMFNTSNNMAENQFGANFAAGQQRYQQGLAQDAQNDLYRQMQLASQGFQNDPTQAYLGAGAGYMSGSSAYGNQAGQANQGLQDAGSWMAQMMGMGGGGSPHVMPQQGGGDFSGWSPQQLQFDPNLFAGQSIPGMGGNVSAPSIFQGQQFPGVQGQISYPPMYDNMLYG